MKHEYRPTGVCARKIEFEVEDGVIKNVKFQGGCNGNLKGIAVLVEGMSTDEVAAKLSGITCGMKPTSCPNELAKAIKSL